MTPEYATAIRAVLLVLSGIAVSHGAYNELISEQIVSGLVAIVMVVWGILSKQPFSSEAQQVADKVKADDLTKPTAPPSQTGFVSPHLLVLVLLAVMVACTQLGIEKPETLNERMAYAYSNVTAVRLAGYNALKAQSIKPEVAGDILTLTDRARAVLDTAQANSVHDAALPDALRAMAMAEGLIVEAQGLLKIHDAAHAGGTP